MARTVQISIKMDAERRGSLERDAASRGITLSEFTRRRLFNEPLPPLISDLEDSEDDAE